MNLVKVPGYRFRKDTDLEKLGIDVKEEKNLDEFYMDVERVMIIAASDTESECLVRLHGDDEGRYPIRMSVEDFALFVMRHTTVNK